MKKIAEQILGHSGKLVSGSKGQYSYDNPRNMVVFNSNLFVITTSNREKIWHGDVDVTVVEDKLIELAKKLDESIFLCHESHGRWEDDEVSEGDALLSITSCGKVTIGPDYIDYYTREQGRLVRVEDEVKPEPILPENLNGDYKEEDFKKIRLPELKSLKSRKKDCCPYMKLWKHVAKELNMETKDLYVGGLYISNYIEDVLKKYLETWCKSTHKLSGYQLQKAMTWHHFDVSPSIFEGSKHGPLWAEKGYIYTKASIVAEKG